LRKTLRKAEKRGIFVPSNKKTLIMKRTKQVFAMTLASAILKSAPTNSRATALAIAWQAVKSADENIALFTFKKTDGTVCRRVVATNFADYFKPTGTGRPKPEGLCLFADLGKHIAGANNPIISTYQVLRLERIA
jgi:hypothetical protein